MASGATRPPGENDEVSRQGCLHEQSPPDESGPPERDFPVDCDECGASLTGCGEEGTCPDCGAVFNRRERVVDTYGPEAFLPDQPKHARAKGGRGRYFRSMILTVVALATIPVAYTLVDRGVLRSDRLPFLLFFFVIVVAEWIRASQSEPESITHDDSHIDQPQRGRK